MNSGHPFFIRIRDSEQNSSVIQERKRRVEHILDTDISPPDSSPFLIKHTRFHRLLPPRVGRAYLLVKRNPEIRMNQIISERNQRVRRVKHHGCHPCIISYRALMPPAVIKDSVAELFYNAACPENKPQRPLHILNRQRAEERPCQLGQNPVRDMPVKNMSIQHLHIQPEAPLHGCLILLAHLSGIVNNIKGNRQMLKKMSLLYIGLAASLLPRRISVHRIRKMPVKIRNHPGIPSLPRHHIGISGRHQEAFRICLIAKVPPLHGRGYNPGICLPAIFLKRGAVRLIPGNILPHSVPSVLIMINIRMRQTAKRPDLDKLLIRAAAALSDDPDSCILMPACRHIIMNHNRYRKLGSGSGLQNDSLRVRMIQGPAVQ